MGQGIEKKVIRETDYGLWGNLSIGKLSNEGEWLSYKMYYENGIDTVFIAKTRSKSHVLSLTGCVSHEFLTEDAIAYLSKDKMLSVRGLKDKWIWKKENVNQFNILPEFNLLVVEKVINGKTQLCILNYAGKELYKFFSTVSWAYSITGGKLAVITQNTVDSECTVLELKDLSVTIAAKTHGTNLEKPVWDDTGKYLACAAIGNAVDKGSLFLYNTNTKKTAVYNADRDSLFPDNRNIISSSIVNISIGQGGMGIFFGIALAEKPKAILNDQIVEVWRSSDKLLYPRLSTVSRSRKPYLAYWDLKKEQVFKIADSITPKVGISGKKQFSITWDSYAYEPQFDRESPVDYYIVNNTTGEKKLWLNHREAGSIYTIKNTNLIVFKDEYWKLYNPETESTIAINIPIDELLPYHGLEKTAFDMKPVSDISGTWLIIHDGFDLWQYNIRTAKKKRLTFGRENSIKYILPEKDLSVWKNYDMNFIRYFDLSKPLLLKMKNEDHSATGYCTLNQNGNIDQIVFGKSGYENLLSDSENKVFVLTTESYEHPRSIISSIKGKQDTIYSSNRHQDQYRWGKASLVSYSSGKRNLQGIIYAPDNIETDKMYPLIVMVYEKLSDQFFFNRMPGLLNSNGFNIANLVSKGYFVLLPDIDYDLGNPGKDALQCVNAAVDASIANYPINPSRLGIIGHSFGGYEVSSVISNSDRFAAAVIGSGITNAISYYLTPNMNNLRPNYWRYEHAQMRIGKSLFEDKNLYLSNSAVYNADNITTPVMIWTGNEDTQVEPEQSYNLHMALRRLQKQSYLLVYPNEGHNISGLEANKDLTHRTEQWFDHFLKDEYADWIK